MGKYKIWDNGKLKNAYCRRPKNKTVRLLTSRTIDEVRKGIKYMEV